MKAILEFNFDEGSDDRMEFEDAINGSKWKVAMWDLDQWLRGNIKHPPRGLHETDGVTAQEQVREYLHEILRESNLTME